MRLLGLSLQFTATLVTAAHLAASLFALWHWSITG
jgi:hypothetical protein